MKIRITTTLVAATLAGCATPDAVRSRPASWSVSVAEPYDDLAACLTGRAAGAANVTPETYRRDRVAWLTLSNLYGNTIGQFEIRSTGPDRSEVAWRRGYVSNWDAMARDWTSRCARPA